MAQTMTPEQVRREKNAARAKQIIENRKYHEDVFDALGIPDAAYDCRSVTFKSSMYALPVGKIGFFESLLKTHDEIYFEVTNFDGTITNPNRTLYLLKDNLHFKSEPFKYEFVEETPAGPQYYVDLKDVPIVTMPAKTPGIQYNNAAQPEDDFVLIVKKEDMPLDKLTARDRVCVDLQVPESTHEWINDLIRLAQKKTTKVKQ